MRSWSQNSKISSLSLELWTINFWRSIDFLIIENGSEIYIDSRRRFVFGLAWTEWHEFVLCIYFRPHEAGLDRFSTKPSFLNTVLKCQLKPTLLNTRVTLFKNWLWVPDNHFKEVVRIFKKNIYVKNYNRRNLIENETVYIVKPNNSLWIYWLPVSYLHTLIKICTHV